MRTKCILLFVVLAAFSSCKKDIEGTSQAISATANNDEALSGKLNVPALIYSGGKTITIYNALNGKVIYSDNSFVSTNAKYAQTPLIIADKAILFLGDKVQAKDVNSGATLWTTSIGKALPEYGTYNASPAFIVDDNIYFTSKRYNAIPKVTNNDFISLNISTGAINWKVALPLFYDMDLPVQVPVCTGNYAYVSVYNTLYAFDLSTGASAWSFNRGNKYLRNPVVAGDKIYAAVDYTTAAEDTLFALDANNGTVKWAYYCGNFGFNAAPAYSNGKVFANLADGAIGLDAEKGTAIWRTTTQEALSPVFADGNTLFLTTSNNEKLYAINATNGNINWQTDISSNPFGAHLTEGPAVMGDMVYVKSSKYYGINKNTGAITWSASLPAFDGNPPFIPNMTDGAGNPLFYASAGMK